MNDEIYEASPGDEYLLRVDKGREYMVGRLREPEGWPWGLMLIRVVSVGDSGVIETTWGHGRPDRYSEGWRYEFDAGTRLFRRTRRYPVYVMPKPEAAELRERLRAFAGELSVELARRGTPAPW